MKTYLRAIYFGLALYSGRKKYIQSLPKSKRIQLNVSWVLDELEKRRFRHLIQHRQNYFEIQYQILATSGLSAGGRSLFFGEIILPCRHG
jgi:hypothetical protein